VSDKKKKQEDEGDGMPTAPGWMATFADMMTLLMTFFILIMSFSTMELDKFKMAMGSLKGALGILGTQKKLRPEQSWFSPYQRNIQTNSVLEHVEKLRETLKENSLEEKVKISVKKGELFIRIKDNMLFNSGEAKLKPNYLKLLSLISKRLFPRAKEIKVEGHTDNVPIHTSQYPSNWELSMARALNVVRYFVKYDHIDPGKLSAAGYGEYKPIVPNNSPENRAKNRRVVIKLKL